MNFQKLSLILLLSVAPLVSKAMDVSASTINKTIDVLAEKLATAQEETQKALIAVEVKKDFDERKETAKNDLSDFLQARSKTIKKNKAKYAKELKAEKERRHQLETDLTDFLGSVRLNGYAAYCASLDLAIKPTEADKKAYKDATKKELAALAATRKEIIKVAQQDEKALLILGQSKAKAALSYELEKKLHEAVEAKKEADKVKVAAEKAKAETASSSWNPFAYFQSSTEQAK